MTALPVPQLSLIVLVGVTGCGKSTFAAEKFGQFEVLREVAARRLRAGPRRVE